MRYRRLGASGLEVSVVGSDVAVRWERGQTLHAGRGRPLVGRAGELGVNLIDTAECCGDHRAASLVGRAIADRERWLMATKFGHRFTPTGSRAKVRSGRYAQPSLVARRGGRGVGFLAAGWPGIPLRRP